MLWTLSLSCLRWPIFVDTAKMGHLCDFQKKLHSSRRRYRDRDIKEPNTSKCVYKIVSHRWDEEVKKLFRKPINFRGSDGKRRGACPNSQRRRLASPNGHKKRAFKEEVPPPTAGNRPRKSLKSRNREFSCKEPRRCFRRITPIACILIWAGIFEARPSELVLR